jgi:DNA-binding MarR family transcriptional regulator
MAASRRLIGEIIHTGRRLTVARDALLAGFGMTSARVRLLKAIRRLPIPFTVAQLARVMDVSRQAARLTARELAAAGLVYLEPNVRHSKAPLVILSDFGRARLEEVLRAEDRWINDLTRGFNERLLKQSEWVIRLSRERADN